MPGRKEDAETRAGEDPLPRGPRGPRGQDPAHLAPRHAGRGDLRLRSRAPRAQGRLPRAPRPLALEGDEGRPGEAFDDGAGGGFPLLGEDRGAGEARQQVEQVPGGAPGRARRVGAQDREGDPLPHGGGGEGEEELLLRRVAPPQRQGVRQVRLPRPAVDLLPVVVREERVLLELGRHRVLVHRQDDRPVRRDAPQDDGVPEDDRAGPAHPSALSDEEPLRGEEGRKSLRPLPRPRPRRLAVGDRLEVVEDREERLHRPAVAFPLGGVVLNDPELAHEKGPHRPGEGGVPPRLREGPQGGPQGAHLGPEQGDLGRATARLRFGILHRTAPPRRPGQPRFPIGPGNDQELLREEVPQVGPRGDTVLPPGETTIRGREDVDHLPAREVVPRDRDHPQEEAHEGDGREGDVEAPRRVDAVLRGDPFPVGRHFRGHLPRDEINGSRGGSVEPGPDPAGGEPHLPFRVGSGEDGERRGRPFRGRGGGEDPLAHRTRSRRKGRRPGTPRFPRRRRADDPTPWRRTGTKDGGSPRRRRDRGSRPRPAGRKRGAARPASTEAG